MNIEIGDLNRRSLFKGAASTFGTLALATPLMGLMSRQAMAAGTGQLLPAVSPYGPLAPVKDLATGLPLLQLSQGFTYRSMSWTGDAMTDGNLVSGAHDGMAVVKSVRNRRTTEMFVIRNHEVGFSPKLTNSPAIYDNVVTGTNRVGGGCSVLKVVNGHLVEQRNSIGGTAVNCAGGDTGWGTWLTCEETTADATAAGGKKHGYVFEVSTDPNETQPIPIVGMGRFSHEATASDPVTGYVYQTEDSRNIAGLYRYKPSNNTKAYGALAQGGQLQAAKVVGIDKANLLAVGGGFPNAVSEVGQELDIEWVNIDSPDANPGPYTDTGLGGSTLAAQLTATTVTASGPFIEARSKGALRMSRGEGIWWGNGVFYIVDTSTGYDPTSGRVGRGLGAVWVYKPDRVNPEKGKLKLLYAALARVAGNNPDNITVSPRGGILTCDDGAAAVDDFGTGQRLMGYTTNGEAYIFGKNNLQLSPTDVAAMGRSTAFIPANDYRGSEFCGACFDPSGRILFVNIQTPGITFAISGPWTRGNL
jgi:uncharacterized protein